MIIEDLTRARLCLRVKSGASGHYIRARIAENEAILERLGVTHHSTGAADAMDHAATVLS
jgi:hypothetical protein